MSNLLYMDGGGAGSNLSILKEAKKLYGPVHFFLGVGVHLHITMETYTSYDFPCQESLVEPIPLDDTVFVAIPWLMAIPWL